MDSTAGEAPFLLMADFISEAERRQLLGWVEQVRPQLKANRLGPQRFSRKLDEMQNVDALCGDVAARIRSAMGIADSVPVELKFRYFISVICDGGFVHLHRDFVVPSIRHLRCNLFLQLSDEGGRPIIDGQPVELRERMLLAFFASDRDHSCETVHGRDRVLLSIGFLLPEHWTFPAGAQTNA